MMPGNGCRGESAAKYSWGIPHLSAFAMYNNFLPPQKSCQIFIADRTFSLGTFSALGSFSPAHFNDGAQ